MTRGVTFNLLGAAAIATALCTGGTTALAQGATGGSLGADNKSLSGGPDRSAPAAVKRPRAERETPRPRRSGGGGGVARFDGIWAVIAIGQSSACAGHRSSSVVTISGGRISGQGVTSGSVSANGATRATGVADGGTTVSTGRLSGNRGSGSFVASNGCTGSLIVSRQ